MSAEAARFAFDAVKEMIPKSENASKGTVIVATVKGDIHDIGKNIVKVLLENFGFDVIDLGRDVDPQIIADEAVKRNCRLVGLSALMTTTVPAMPADYRAVKGKISQYPYRSRRRCFNTGICGYDWSGQIL